VKVFVPKFNSLSLEMPANLGGFLSPKFMPPLGPKPGVVNI
jgi:hypothetical protein